MSDEEVNEEVNGGGIPIPPEYRDELRWVAQHNVSMLAMQGEPVRYFIGGIEVDYPSAAPKTPYSLGYEASSRCDNKCPFPNGSAEASQWWNGFGDSTEDYIAYKEMD